MKEDIVLDFLRDNRESFVSGEEISKKLKVSRTAVWKEMQNLRKTGYEITAIPRRGYRLTRIPDKLFSDEIAYGLKNRLIGKQILSYEELDSTNDVAFKLGEQGMKEGVCVFTEYQKKGRGRLGRTWVAPKGKNLLFSVLLRPLLSPTEVSKMTLVAAISVVKAVKKTCGVTLGIKWPNDILFQDLKVCGILTEMSAESDRVNFIVLGIGVNLNADKKDLPSGSASLKQIIGQPVARVEFARNLLRELETDYLRLKNGEFDDLAKDWEEYSVTSGKRVAASMLGRKIQGQATGIDRDGALWIRLDNGLQERILAGDIQHLR